MVIFLVFLAFWAFGWILMLVFGHSMIAWLKNLKGMKWSPREDTPDSHLIKAGVPSMGGIGIIGAALGAYFAALFVLFLASRFPVLRLSFPVWNELPKLLLFPLVVALHAGLGLMDDWSKARGTGGLLARQKLIGQFGLAASFIVAATLLGWRGLEVALPFVAFGFLMLVIIAASNAVNLTDGIDGLAAGLSVQVGLAMTIAAFLKSSAVGGVLPGFVFTFWLCLSGACFGFLAFNKHPAKVFMGDTGSLALGAALGAGAVVTGTVWLLPFIGFIFWVEMFSVVFQVLYFKYTKKKFGEGRRIFRRAPLHHHFELGGWSEWKVVTTFWLVNLGMTILGLILWKMGVLPRFP